MSPSGHAPAPQKANKIRSTSITRAKVCTSSLFTSWFSAVDQIPILPPSCYWPSKDALFQASLPAAVWALVHRIQDRGNWSLRYCVNAQRCPITQTRWPAEFLRRASDGRPTSWTNDNVARPLTSMSIKRPRTVVCGPFSLFWGARIPRSFVPHAGRSSVDIWSRRCS